MGVESDGHKVQFYEDHAFLVRSVVGHLGDALAHGGSALLVARANTRIGVAAELEAHGHDVAALAREGRFVSRDADETLAALLVDGMPDHGRFRDHITATIERAAEARPGRPIHAFGEMVDILWSELREGAMLKLEALWSELCRATSTSLLCGYRLAGFTKPEHAHAFEAVRAAHDPLETFGDLERRTLTLEYEVARRTLVERRMQQLLELTGELAAARTRDEIAALVLDKGMTAVGAAAIALWVHEGDGLEMLARSSRFGDVGEFHRLSLDADLPLPAALRSGEPVFLSSPEDYAARFPASYERVLEILPFPEFAFAALPMTASTTLGGIVFTYDRRREFEPTERAFKAIVARQCAVALERVAALDHERSLRVESELLYQLAAEVNRLESTYDVCELALAAVERGTSSDRAAIMLLDDAGKMRFRSHHRLPETCHAAIDGHSPWSAETTDPQPISIDTETDPAWASYRHVFRVEGVRALAFVPLVHRGMLIGTFMLSRDRPQAFGARELQLASTVAVHVAQAFERSTSDLALARAFREERAAHLEAEEATRAREEILSVVSHDLRNPLGTIMIGASTLLQIEVTDRQRVRAVAGRIHRQAEHMARLIDDLVDFAAIRSGRVALARGVHEPAKILDATSDMFGAIATEHGVAFEAVTPPHLPNIDCDSERAVQVFSNLVSNAIKVTPRGGMVEIGAQPSNSEVVFFVRDTGPGIEANDLPMLFERFWRGKSSPYKGAGLGLSIARGIVDAHGGRIWAESQVGKGSTFFFSLST